MADDTEKNGPRSGLVWTQANNYLRAQVGPIGVTARRSRGGSRTEANVACFSPYLNESRRECEQALQQMHLALAQHFGPVLRWKPIFKDGVDTGMVRGAFDVDESHPMSSWRLQAWDGAFQVWWENHEKWYGMKGETVSETMRAAENALRGFGVVFAVDYNEP